MAGVVAVLGREVEVDQLLLGLTRRPVALVGQRLLERERDELVLGGEVAVEAAVGEAGLGHQLADVDARDAALAQKGRRAVDDLLPMELGVFS